MKVAIVWNDGAPLSQCSFRFEAYVDGLARLGHEAVVVCARRSADDLPVPKHVVEKSEDLEDPATWRAVGASAAFAVTWLRMAKMLEAMRAAGTRTVAITDSDGQLGVSVHPRATLRQALAAHSSFTARSRILAGTMRQLVRRGNEANPEDREHLAGAAAADVVIFGNRRAAECFGEFARHHGRSELMERVAVVPPAIHDVFTRVPAAAPRPPGLFAVGRWSAAQKNAALLRAALERALRKRPIAVDIFGAGSEDALAPLCRRFPHVAVHGTAAPDVLARTAAARRAIVFASRWEGHPHAAAEALAAGATVVGTPLPCFLSCADEGVGCVARRARPAALAAAILEEMDQWDRGRRDGARIAAEWRQRVSGEAVSRALLEALEDRVSR